MRYERSVTDRLYVWLGFFTNVYLLLIAIEFFSGAQRRYPQLAALLDTFSEPYLGALAVYVVLKEIHKRRGTRLSRHRGEWFVAAWLTLLIITTVLVAATAFYPFDLVYRLVIANSLTALMIYFGARIRTP